MYIKDCGYDFPHKKGEFCTRRNTTDFYFISCFSTPFLYESEKELKYGNAGDLLLMPPGIDVYHGPLSEEEAFINDWIYVSGEDLEKLFAQYPLPQNIATPIGNPHYLKGQIRKIKEEQLLKRPGYEEIISYTVAETIICLHRMYIKEQHTDSAVARLEAAREIFLRNPQKDWSLQEMAAASGYSVSRFSALYCSQFGRSPKADLLTSRIEQAKQLLSYSELSVTEIAERCGFKSLYYFSKYFKKITGMPPNEYRKRE